MTWNYRVVQRNEAVSIYSVYYDLQGHVKGVSKEPAKVIGYSIEGLAGTLQLMKECMIKPVLLWEDIGSEE